MAPHLLHGRPDGPLDEDPGEAGHAEEHGDGQEDVGDETEQDRGPVDLREGERLAGVDLRCLYLEAGLVRIWNNILPTVWESITGQTERHAEPTILLLELLVCGTLVLRSL